MNPGRTRAKICGLTSEREVEMAVEAGADAVGFVVRVPVDTHRQVTVERAHRLVDSVPPFVTSVAVTMPPTVEEAGAVAVDTGADVLQVHDPEFAGGRELQEHGVNLLQRARLDEEPPEHADAYIVDAEDEEGGGGTGETVDWDAAAGFVEDVDRPVVLAGGLTPDNVGTAVEEVEPFGVDVSSGVERGSEKDPDAVEDFVEAVRRADG